MTIDSTIDGRPGKRTHSHRLTAQQGSPSLLGNEMLINITPGTAVGQPGPEGAILPSSSSNTVNDFATSGTDLAQRLSKLVRRDQRIVAMLRTAKEPSDVSSPTKRFTTTSTPPFARLKT